jgi:hypothetical protein
MGCRRSPIVWASEKIIHAHLKIANSSDRVAYPGEMSCGYILLLFFLEKLPMMLVVADPVTRNRDAIFNRQSLYNDPEKRYLADSSTACSMRK